MGRGVWPRRIDKRVLFHHDFANRAIAVFHDVEASLQLLELASAGIVDGSGDSRGVVPLFYVVNVGKIVNLKSEFFVEGESVSQVIIFV